MTWRRLYRSALVPALLAALTMAMGDSAAAAATGTHLDPVDGQFLAGAAAMLAALGWVVKLFRSGDTAGGSGSRESDVRWQVEVRELAKANKDTMDRLAQVAQAEFAALRRVTESLRDMVERMVELYERTRERE